MTLLGLGSFDQTRPESLDMLGMHGTAYANYAVQECDLLIAIGARFDDRVTGNVKTFAPHAKTIHIDIDPASISKNVHVDIPVVGDAKAILKELLEKVEHRPRKDWFKKIADWKKKYPMRYDNNTSNIKPQYVIEEIYNHNRSRAKPDVDGSVLPVQPAETVYKLRRPWDDGLRTAGGNRRSNCKTRRNGNRYRRRPQL
jgi:acetolactate synthase-1/2/3 large subunit